MKIILKLLIAAVIVNAAVRGGKAYLEHYQLEDEAQQQVLFGYRFEPEELHDKIMNEAQRLGVPLESDALVVEREGTLTTAHASYVRPIELFPAYTYQAELSFDVEGRNITAVPMPKKRR